MIHPDLREPSDLEIRAEEADSSRFMPSSRRADYYSLLGVPRTADRKQIKAAYYGLAAKFHTDRHFGKSLGAFKPKMEQIFGRITIANDTLTAAMRREEYESVPRHAGEDAGVRAPARGVRTSTPSRRGADRSVDDAVHRADPIRRFP